MLQVENRIELKASPQRVWTALTRLEGYARWHPFITMAGETRVGAKINYTFRNKAFRRSFTAPVTVTRNNEPTGFGWTIGVRRILFLEETFEIEPGPDGVTLRHCMVGSGVLARIPIRAMERRLRRFIVETDEALDRFLRGAAKPSSVPGNRIKRRTDKARTRHLPSTPSSAS